MKQKAIFFDRDGVVNVKLENDYVKTLNEFVFCADFFRLFQYLKQQQYLAILVTNQQCIGKGIISESDLSFIHFYMNRELKQNTGFRFDAIYHCPNLAADNSPRRKPATGMFEEAIAQFDIDIANSWTIGDSVSDIIAGNKVGTKTILIDNNLSKSHPNKNNSPANKTLQKKDSISNFVMNNLADVIAFFENYEHK